MKKIVTGSLLAGLLLTATPAQAGFWRFITRPIGIMCSLALAGGVWAAIKYVPIMVEKTICDKTADEIINMVPSPFQDMVKATYRNQLIKAVANYRKFNSQYKFSKIKKVTISNVSVLPFVLSGTITTDTHTFTISYSNGGFSLSKQK